MGMITEFVRLRESDLMELVRLLDDDPDGAYEFTGDLADQHDDERDAPRGMDTDKAWAGLQVLLSRADCPVDVIGGGTPLTDAVWGYDSPRLLTVEDVSAAAEFLVTTPFPRLASHYDATQFAADEVYPQIWDEDDALDYLEGHYAGLVSFYGAAAAGREYVLVWLS
jgi:hypothetical protein